MSKGDTSFKPLSVGEFVAMLALMVSILALSIDAMLPALGVIGSDLGVVDRNNVQLVVTVMFLGLAAGQIVVGPLSDCYGRKPVIYVSYLIFVTGCLLSMLAGSFEVMLAGRLLQGLGAAGPRIVSTALVRDGYEGRAMARIMSAVMAIFIVVPTVAPAVGQAVLSVASWRAIFGLFLTTALIAFMWFAVRQPETLPVEARRPFSITGIAAGIKEALGYRAMAGYTLAAGIIFGAFVGYLSSAQQVFQEVYATGQWFAVYFGVASLALGVASVCNAKLVMRWGMQYLTWRAVIGLTCVSMLYIPFVLMADGLPPFGSFMVWLLLAFFCMGMLFGNINALAMEPVGHMAGLGAAVVGSVSTFVALPLGWAVGSAFDGTVTPLVIGFTVCGLLCLTVILWIDRGKGAKSKSDATAT